MFEVFVYDCTFQCSLCIITVNNLHLFNAFLPQLQSPLVAALLGSLAGGVRVPLVLLSLDPLSLIHWQASTLTGSNLRLLACSGTLLSNVLEFSGNITAEQVSDALCSLTDEQFNELATELRQQINFVSGGIYFEIIITLFLSGFFCNRIVTLIQASCLPFKICYC